VAILKIALMGNPILGRVAEPVADPTDPAIVKLAADMLETLENIGANGLAAPQVHVSRRVVVYRVAPHQIPPGAKMKPIPWRTLVNPAVMPLTEEKKPIWERCLSVPSLHGQVPRFTKVRVVAKQTDGSDLTIEATGFHAMLLQHEIDHLDGILYPMRMTDLSTLAFNSELGDLGFYIRRSPTEFMD
jgi:peptide deformylase